MTDIGKEHQGQGVLFNPQNPTWINKTHLFPTSACIVRTVVSDIFSVHAMPCKPPMQRERLSPPSLRLCLPPLHLYFLLYFLYAARAHKWLCVCGRSGNGGKEQRICLQNCVLVINAPLSVDDVPFTQLFKKALSAFNQLGPIT